VANRSLAVLGRAARLARSVGLGGALRALRDGADSVFLGVDRPPLKASVDGVRVRGYLRHRSFLDEVVRPTTTYRSLFVRSLRPGMTVVDGGAHVGVYTVLASRGVGADGRVLAFEPDPYNFRALAFNASGRANVRLLPKALGEERRWAVFHESAGTIGSSLIPHGNLTGESVVEVTTIDAELTRRELGDLLVKLNVEGAEPLVLEGMKETLARCAHAVLFVEVAPALLGTEAQGIVGKLEELGFEVSRIDVAEQSLVRVDASTRLPKCHLFAERHRRVADGPSGAAQSATRDTVRRPGDQTSA
jgi:FkbM family methyltransferase